MENLNLVFAERYLKQDQKFKIQNPNKTEINLIDFCKSFISENKGCEIIVGADSQTKGKITEYAVAVVLKYPNNKGARVVATKILLPKIGDIFTRLYAEAQMSMEVAELLENNEIKVDQIDLDYSGKQHTKSTNNFNAVYNWIYSFGFKVVGKPSKEESEKFSKKKIDTQSACIAADKICR